MRGNNEGKAFVMGADAFLFTTKVDFVMKRIDIEIEKMRPGTYDKYVEARAAVANENWEDEYEKEINHNITGSFHGSICINGLWKLFRKFRE